MPLELGVYEASSAKACTLTSQVADDYPATGSASTQMQTSMDGTPVRTKSGRAQAVLRYARKATLLVVTSSDASLVSMKTGLTPQLCTCRQ